MKRTPYLTWIATACVASMAHLHPARAAAPAVDDDVLQRASDAFAAVAERTLPAVVFISVEKTVQMGRMPGPYSFNNPFELFEDDFLRRFFGQQAPPPQQRERQFKQQGQGSGFIISKDGYILTNNHVVGDADKIRVKTHDGKEYEAKRIGSDPKSEVALIKIEGNDFPFLTFGDSSKIRIGEWVIAVGNPFGLTETLTVGVISAKGRNNMGITDYEDFIQTDAAINPGNSGGPLLNTRGEVIGINTAIYSQSGGYMGIGFAIPINLAADIKAQLLKTGKVVRGYLGIQIQQITPDIAKSFGLDSDAGILVSEVEEGSAAEKAGVQADDIILELNGNAVTSVNGFRNEIASNPPGTDIELTVLRDGKRRTIKARTATLQDGSADDEASGEAPITDIGLTVQELDPPTAERFGYALGAGVLVTEVDPSGVAMNAGIQPGDLIVSVNRKPVKNQKDFAAALKLSNESHSVLLKVRRGGFARYVVLQLD